MFHILLVYISDYLNSSQFTNITVFIHIFDSAKDMKHTLVSATRHQRKWSCFNIRFRFHT